MEKYDGVTVVLESIPDISSDKNAVKKLVGLCNGKQLSLIHLTDVVNDFLTDV
ncbi:MAG: hypothetical protein IKL40_06070 [Clostridia bacterium]|nr:hypothetical protein [Clostridia bacterium]